MLLTGVEWIAGIHVEPIAVTAQADVSDETQVEEMFAKVRAQLGGVDILVNNAGLQHVAPVEEFPVDTWERLVRIMLFGAFYLTRAALPQEGQTSMRFETWIGASFWMGGLEEPEFSCIPRNRSRVKPPPPDRGLRHPGHARGGEPLPCRSRLRGPGALHGPPRLAEGPPAHDRPAPGGPRP